MRARAVGAQIDRGAVGGAALRVVEVIEDAADGVVHRHGQRRVVDGRSSVGEIDGRGVAGGLIRRRDAVGDARGVLAERDAEAMPAVAAKVVLRGEARREFRSFELTVPSASTA